jgi:hypothetical protein
VDVESCLAAVETALLDADATLWTELGEQREQSTARLWRGQVLIDWEPDGRAGDCLLRPELLRRLLALHARSSFEAETWQLVTPGHIVAGLSPEHADLVRQLGGERRVELVARLRFEAGVYRGGEETYRLVQTGRRDRVAVLRLGADVRIRTTGGAWPRTSRGTT